MKFEIEKVKDGTFTSRIRSYNGKITFANHNANTKQGAYKNLCINVRLIGEAWGIKVHGVRKAKNMPVLYLLREFGENVVSRIPVLVKEINC